MENALGVQFRNTFRQGVPLPFIGRRVESWIPYEVWREAEFYILATLPDIPGERGPSVAFDVTIKWNIPEGNNVARFRVTATPTNGNIAGVPNPALTCNISFTAEKLQP